MITVELEIKLFSLVALSYQPSFNTTSRHYVVYVLTIRQNQSYFNIYCLYRILSTKQTKNKWPCFLSGPYCPIFKFLRIFLLTYGQTLRKILLRSYLPFSLHWSALYNNNNIKYYQYSGQLGINSTSCTGKNWT